MNFKSGKALKRFALALTLSFITTFILICFLLDIYTEINTYVLFSVLFLLFLPIWVLILYLIDKVKKSIPQNKTDRKFFHRRIIMNIIKKIFDIICFVGGSFLLGYSLFNFLGAQIRYFESSRIGIGLGLSLISLGFLVNKWRKENENR